jgi:hypothetical protein
MPVDKTTRRHRKEAVQALERAEGLETPTIPHNHKAVKAAVDALRRLERAADDLRDRAADDLRDRAADDDPRLRRVPVWHGIAACERARVALERALARASGHEPHPAMLRRHKIAAACDRVATRLDEEDRLLTDFVEDLKGGSRVVPDPRTVSLDAERTDDGASLHEVIAGGSDPLDLIIRQEEALRGRHRSEPASLTRRNEAGPRLSPSRAGARFRR